MAARVLLSPQAAADIEAIGDHIAADNPSAALRFVARLRQRCAELDQLPERGKRIGERHRALIEPPYLIVYRIDASTMPVTVIIGTVLHGARNWTERGDW